MRRLIFIILISFCFFSCSKKNKYEENLHHFKSLINDINIYFQDSNKKEIKSYDEIISVSSIKIITQDSVNMIYESLSSRGETILFNMDYFKNNKIVKQIHKLLKNKQVGYIDDGDLTKDLKAMKIIKQQNKDLFAEVEKLAYKVNQFLQE